uniref:Fibroblast growth factor n=1 Tax=Megaselia scalaris TaxID=36166 RepID=T1GXJ3_MEGSC
MIGVPRSKTKSDIQYLTLFSKDTELYICYNKKWRIVGMKNPSERCYFKEGRHFEFISYLNNSMYIGFVCKNGACKSAGPEEKSECFSSTKHEPNVIYDYYRKHNNSHHRIRHRKHHQKHRDKHHLHTTTTITTSTTSTTPTTTTTTSTTTTTPQPARRRNKKKSKLSKKRPKPSKASEFVTAELLSTVYSSSIGYQTETVTPSSPFTVDLDSTSATSGSSSDSSDTSSISSVMDSSSYGTTDTRK